MKTPWTLVGACVLLLGLVGYLLFGAYMPSKQHIAQLEAEIRDVSAREALLRSQIGQQGKEHALREQQLAAVTAERDALTKRMEELEAELSAAKRVRRR